MLRKIVRISDRFEELLIVILLALMTGITFANVVARYVFNANLLWALEATVFLFAWLVLIGAAYCFAKNLHLGVDILVRQVPPSWQRGMEFFSIFACLIFSLLLLKGSWDYWHPFVTTRAFLETDDIPMPELLQFLSAILNEGERYEKLPRFIPYFALPLGMFLLTLRVLQKVFQFVRRNPGGGASARSEFSNMPRH